MLGQATAMLITLPTAIAAKFGPGAFPFALDHMPTLASPAVAVLGADRLSGRNTSIHRGLGCGCAFVELAGRGLTSDQRLPTRAVDAAGKV